MYSKMLVSMILKAPSGAKILASNEFEKHHAFSLYGHIWGLQFHPESDADITHAYIDELKDLLLSKGYDTEKLHESVKEHSYGRLLLKRFIEIVKKGLYQK